MFADQRQNQIFNTQQLCIRDFIILYYLLVVLGDCNLQFIDERQEETSYACGKHCCKQHVMDYFFNRIMENLCD